MTRSQPKPIAGHGRYASRVPCWAEYEQRKAEWVASHPNASEAERNAVFEDLKREAGV